MSIQKVQRGRIEAQVHGQGHRLPTPYPGLRRWNIPHERSTGVILPLIRHQEDCNSPLSTSKFPMYEPSISAASTVLLAVALLSGVSHPAVPER